MKVPPAIFSAGEDWLSFQIIIIFDFVWTKNANEIIYQDLVNGMQQYHPIQ